jgi:hypothetical protein
METEAIIKIADNATAVLVVIITLTFIYECIKIFTENGNKH